jgi:hypothetical protein
METETSGEDSSNGGKKQKSGKNRVSMPSTDPMCDIFETCSKILFLENGLHEYLSMCRNFAKDLFVIMDDTQTTFSCMFCTYKEQIQSENNSINRKKKRKFVSTAPDPMKAEMEVVFYSVSDDKKTRTEMITVRELAIILAKIINGIDWRLKIRRRDQIPYAILKDLSTRGIRFNRIFPNIQHHSIYLEKNADDNEDIFEESLNTFMCVLTFKAFSKKLRTFQPQSTPNIEMTEESDGGYMSDSDNSLPDIIGDEELNKIQKNGGFVFSGAEISQITYDKIDGVEPCGNKKNTNLDRFSGDPYTASAAIFATCNLGVYRMKIKMNEKSDVYSDLEKWLDVRKLYHLAYDWLNDQVVPHKNRFPKDVYYMLKAILILLTGLPKSELGSAENSLGSFYWTACDWYLSLFSNIRPMVKTFHCSGPLKSNRASVVRYKISTQQTFRRGFEQTISHRYYNDLHGRSSSLMCRKKIKDYVVLEFARESASALQLFSTMKALKFYLYGNDSLWDLFYDEHTTYIMVSKNWYDTWVQYRLPCMIYSGKSVNRNVPFPIYPIEMINYFKGGKDGILSCMRFILRTFCGSLEDTDRKMMPSDMEDPCIEAYGIFHIIVNRFKDQATIWNHLVEPFRSFEQIMFNSKKFGSRLPMMEVSRFSRDGKKEFKKKKVVDYKTYIGMSIDGDIKPVTNFDSSRDRVIGLRENTYSIYSGLRSFIHCKAVHYISRNMIENLHNAFTHQDLSLQVDHPLVFSLIKRLLVRSEKKNEEDIPIPMTHLDIGCSYDEDLPPDYPSMVVEYIEPGLVNFPLPLHFILYYFCISPKISDFFALSLFNSITTKVKSKKATNSITFSFRSSNGIDKFRPHQNIYNNMLCQHQKDPEADESHYSEGMNSLLSSLEELSLFPVEFTSEELGVDDKKMFRGNRDEPALKLSISPRDIIDNDETVIKNLPIDMRKTEDGSFEYFHIGDCLPVFAPEIRQRRDNVSYYDVRKYLSDGLLPPFYHSGDFLECVLMYPITHIQCVSTETCGVPDMDSEPVPVITSENQMFDWCPHDYRVNNYYIKDNGLSPTMSSPPKFSNHPMVNSDWFLKIMGERDRWNCHPPLFKILQKSLEYARQPFIDKDQ